MSARRAVTYLRVSTARQGASGLGLEAQRAAVQAYAASGGLTIVAEYVEVESGRRDDRPQLAAALAACRLHRATLVIAKLDRLARSVAVISRLMRADVPLECVDFPHANAMTLHILAAMAEHEAAVISERTKAALAAAKARGVRLGNPNGAAHLLGGCLAAAALSAAARGVAAADRARTLEPILGELRSKGFISATSQARELNRRGVPAPKGGVWYAEQVRRTENRLREASVTSRA